MLRCALVTASILVAAGAGHRDEFARLRRMIEVGEHADARVELEILAAADPGNATLRLLLGRALHGQGEFARALEELAKAAGSAAAAEEAAFHAARACARLDRRDEAFAWLERALEVGFSDWQALSIDADLEPLRADPRFGRCLPHSTDPARPFVEKVVVLHDSHGGFSGDWYGAAASGLGDLDRDGIGDFAIGAPWDSDGETHRGAVHVYSGRKREHSFTIRGEAGDRLGSSIAPAGDVDGDGHADLAIGAPGGDEMPGTVAVISGKDGAQLRLFYGQATGDGFGESIAEIGDVNGDGAADLAVAAPRSDAAGTDAGRVYVISLSSQKVLAIFEGGAIADELGSGGVAGFARDGELCIASASRTAGPEHRGLACLWKSIDPAAVPIVLAGEDAARNRGARIALVGDLDRDGWPDFLTSDERGASAPSVVAARAWLWSSKDGRKLFDLTGCTPGDGFGVSAARAGDLDRDGVEDLAIGAWRDRSGAPWGGRVEIRAGADGSALATLTGALARDGLGYRVASLGDVDADKVPDLLVTAPFHAARGPSTGRAFVISGASLAPRPPAVEPAKAGDER